MPGIVGRKIGMTRVIQDDGRVIPVTLVKCDPNTIIQVKTKSKDGYPALVLGFDARKKPTKNRKFYFIQEFKVENEEQYKLGDQVSLEILKDQTDVTVSATSKGKGFQGVVKKFHFAGGPSSHGSHQHREPGSIGCRTKPGRVHKGKKLPGRMGGKNVTLKKVPVIEIDHEKNLLALKGPIPGATNSYITLTI